jgi:hypothetical protein
MFANCGNIWERDYARLALLKKVKKGDAFEEWLCRGKGEDTVTDEFRRYSTAGSAIPATEKFDSIAWRRRLPYPPTLALRYIRLPSDILRMRASLQ